MTLQELIDWQAADKNDRYVDIDLMPGSNPRVWVYSARSQEGMHMTVDQSIADIDLEGKNAKAERAQYKILKQKYGGE